MYLVVVGANEAHRENFFLSAGPLKIRLILRNSETSEAYYSEFLIKYRKGKEGTTGNLPLSKIIGARFLSCHLFHNSITLWMKKTRRYLPFHLLCLQKTWDQFIEYKLHKPYFRNKRPTGSFLIFVAHLTISNFSLTLRVHSC